MTTGPDTAVERELDRCRYTPDALAAVNATLRGSLAPAVQRAAEDRDPGAKAANAA